MTTLDYNKPEVPRRPWWVNLLIVLGVFGVVAAVLFVATVIVFYFQFRGPAIHYLDFDSIKWQAATHDTTHNSVRLRMADDFLSTQHPLGKTREQIVALLGEPDDTPYFREYDMVYYLGPERGAMAIDSEWLVLKLSNGVVVEAKLTTD